MSKPGILELRVGWAQRAVAYVVHECKIRSCNQLKNFWRIDRAINLGYQRTWATDNSSLSYTRELSDLAKSTQLGNCADKSAVAFMFLYEKNPNILRPLSWLSVGSSHMIVAIGRVSTGKSRMNEPSTWPTDTVICDPWREVVHFGSDWSTYQSGNGSDIIEQLYIAPPGEPPGGHKPGVKR